MDAHNGAAPPISTDPRRASFHEAARAAHAVEAATSVDKLDDWNPPARKQETEGENYGSKSLFAAVKEQVGSTRMTSIAEESYGSSRFLPEEEGVSAHNSGLAGESYESRRFLLSVASGRVKKKRRSRASSKAPITVFSTDTTNFMAMVHKLTGIPSNASPFHSTLPPPWAPKMLPFNQGLHTLDTSTLLLPTFTGDRGLNSISYPGMQTLASQQQRNPVCPDKKTTSQASQPAANMDCTSSSYSDLMRSMCSSVNSSSLPRLWEASYASEKCQQAQNSFTEVEGITRQEPSHPDAAMDPNLPTSGTLSRLEMLLAGSGKLASSSTSMLTSCMAKEELL